MKTEQFTPQQVADAIRTKVGFVSHAADLLGCSIKTVYSYKDKYDEVKEACAEAEERKLDLAEAKLVECVKEKKAWAVCFYLKCKGKGRGFVERQEFTGKDGEPLKTQTIKIGDKEIEF